HSWLSALGCSFCFYVNFALSGDYLQLRQGPGRRTLYDIAGIRIEEAAVTGTFDLVDVCPIPDGASQMGAFLFESPPLIGFQMDEDIGNDFAPFNFKLKHLPDGN